MDFDAFFKEQLDEIREDGRYRMLRQQWGAQAGRNFFFFFQRIF